MEGRFQFGETLFLCMVVYGGVWWCMVVFSGVGGDV